MDAGPLCRPLTGAVGQDLGQHVPYEGEKSKTQIKLRKQADKSWHVLLSSCNCPMHLSPPPPRSFLRFFASQPSLLAEAGKLGGANLILVTHGDCVAGLGLDDLGRMAPVFLLEHIMLEVYFGTDAKGKHLGQHWMGG